MKKLIHILLHIIIAYVTIAFSHVIWLFDKETIFGLGFESVKVQWFLILTAILFVLYGASFFTKDSPRFTNKTEWIMPLMLGGLWIIGALLSEQSSAAISGFGKKDHGLFVYLGLLLTYIVFVSTHKKDELKQYFYTFFATSIFVFLYALVQKIGADPLLFETRVPRSRAFATFGNANYLAGYAIVLLPLIQLLRDQILQIFFGILLLTLLISSGSWLGVVLIGLYIFYKGWLYIRNKHVKNGYYAIIIGIICISAYKLFLNNSEIVAHIFEKNYFAIHDEKIKGFLARFYFWKTTFAAWMSEIHFVFLWAGFENLIFYFESFRDPALSALEDPNFTADRAHNVFIDTLFFTGIFSSAILFGTYFKGIFQNKYLPISESLVLFGLYFSFNIPVLIHFLILVLLFAYTKK